jgi:hypothetical protein
MFMNKQMIKIIALSAVLYGCDSGGSSTDINNTSSTDINNTQPQSNLTIQRVISESEGPGLKGLQTVDGSGNTITTYISDDLLDDSMLIVGGVDLGKPDSYEMVTNEFIEMHYPESIGDQLQTIKVKPIERFNTVMIFDADENIMKRAPYVDISSDEIEFKAQPINGVITFALFYIAE